MIKLIACDLDGTLFNESMSVSEKNIQAIHRVQKNNIEFLVATGRAPKESQDLIHSYGLNTGFINMNGALVYDTEGNEVLKNPINLSKAKIICNLLREAGFYFEIVTQEGGFSEDLNQRISNVAHLMVDLNPYLSFKDAVMISASNSTIMNIHQVDSFDNILDDSNTEIMKILAFDHRGADAFSKIKEQLTALGHLAITSSSATNIEINDVAAQKGIALLNYAKKKGIKPQEIAAIGDNMNDASMIKDAGVGIAMGNAVPGIKELATFVTKKNTEDGVAYALNKIIQNNATEK